MHNRPDPALGIRTDNIIKINKLVQRSHNRSVNQPFIFFAPLQKLLRGKIGILALPCLLYTSRCV